MVTILILIDGFLQYEENIDYFLENEVTILILIDGFLQYIDKSNNIEEIIESQSLF